MSEAVTPPDLPKRSPYAKLQEAPGLSSRKVIKQQLTKEMYEVGDDISLLWELIDGNRSIKELARLMQETGVQVDQQYVHDQVEFMAREGLLDGTEPIQNEGRFRVASAFELDIVILRDSTEAFRTWAKWLRPFLNNFWLIFSFAFVISGLLAFSSQFPLILGNRQNFQVLGSTVFGFLFYTVFIFHPMGWLHEYAHGIALAKYGGEPGEVGLGLYYFGPFFYVDTSDAVRLTTRKRIMVSMAGPLVSLMVGSSFALLSLFSPLQIVRMAAFFSYYWTMFWFLPLLENDGYYAFADLIGKPNLMRDALHYTKSRLHLEPVKEELKNLSGTEAFNLLFYASLFVVFSGFIVLTSGTFLYFMYKDVVGSIQLIWLYAAGTAVESAVLTSSLANIIVFSMVAVGFAAYPLKALKGKAGPQES